MRKIDVDGHAYDVDFNAQTNEIIFTPMHEEEEVKMKWLNEQSTHDAIRQTLEECNLNPYYTRKIPVPPKLHGQKELNETFGVRKQRTEPTDECQQPPNTGQYPPPVHTSQSGPVPLPILPEPMSMSEASGLAASPNTPMPMSEASGLPATPTSHHEPYY